MEIEPTLRTNCDAQIEISSVGPKIRAPNIDRAKSTNSGDSLLGTSASMREFRITITLIGIANIASIVDLAMAPIIERDATRILPHDRLRVHRKEWIVDCWPIIFGF